MHTNRLPQSNVASLPPPGAVVMAPLPVLHGTTSHPPASALPLQARTSNTLHPPSTIVASCHGHGLGLIANEVGHCLAEALQARWASYRQQLCNCQEEFSEEAVHEVRVATRRLMAQLALLSCVLKNPAPEKARRMLKRRVGALGELRDNHVGRMFIDRALLRFPELALLSRFLGRQERRAAKAAAAKVGRCKNRKLEKWLDAVSSELNARSHSARARMQLAATVLRATAAAFAEAVERRQAIDLADLGTVHRMRVAFKRFRYMVESLSPRITGLSKRQLRALAYYQRKMGIIQDLEVLQHCVAHYVRQHKTAGALLGPFSRYLARRRARALASFLRSADQLYTFWPPARLIAPVGVRSRHGTS